MNTDLFFDILRIVLLVIQVVSAAITIIIVVLSRKVSITSLLSKLTSWYIKSMEDGKISPEEMTECIKMIKELSDISDTKSTSTETKEETTK